MSQVEQCTNLHKSEGCNAGNHNDVAEIIHGVVAVMMLAGAGQILWQAQQGSTLIANGMQAAIVAKPSARARLIGTALRRNKKLLCERGPANALDWKLQPCRQHQLQHQHHKVDQGFIFKSVLPAKASIAIKERTTQEVIRTCPCT